MIDELDELGGEFDYDGEESTRVTDGPDEELMGALKDQQSYLVVIAGTNVGEMYRIEGVVDIGRDKQAGIRIVDEGISRRHCQVRQLPMGKLLVEDLGSTNGTFANGERITKEALADGGKIQIGSSTILKFAFTDVLDEDFQRQMYESALTDGLTKVYNKRFYSERIEVEFSSAHRTHAHLALIMMDIDHFKKLNDTYGHPAGDYALQTLAQAIKPLLSEDDIFCRYGGEEFVVVTHADLADAAILAETIRQTIEAHDFSWNGSRLKVTLSLGVAGMPDAEFSNHAELLNAADGALYRAKNGGRNRVKVHGAGE